MAALLPRAFPGADRVEVIRNWSYEWWSPEREMIALPATADNTPDEDDVAAIDPTAEL